MREGVAAARMRVNQQPAIPDVIWGRILGSVIVVCMGVSWPLRADLTWLYAVQISATIQTDPPQITLSWEPDPYGASSYTVCRKLKTDTDWSAATTLPGDATSYTDSDVTDDS